MNISYAGPFVVDSFLDREFTLDDLTEVLSLIKDGKATGDSGVPMEFLKYGSPDLQIVLLYRINQFYNGNINSLDNKSIIISLHEKL